MDILKRLLFTIDKVLFKIADVIMLMASVGLVFSVSFQVFGRYVLNKSPRWTTEFACFSLLLLVFWGSAIALRKKMHVEIDIYKYGLPIYILKIFRIVNIISVYFFIAILFYYGSLVTIDNKSSLSEAMKISYAYIYVHLPISSLLMFIGYTNNLINKKEIKEDIPL